LSKENSLEQKTINGLMWSFGDLVANQFIQFVIQIVLARLLMPENFGLIGMVLVFIAFSNMLIDSGITQALIRETNAHQKDYSTIFYFNFFMSLALYGALFLFSPMISDFFHEPQLIKILRVLSLVILINSVSIIHRTQLIKRIEFKTQTIINIVSGIVSGIIAVFLAINDYGVWSLVVRLLSLQIFQTGLLWVLNRWRPSFEFDYSSLKRMFGFGWKILVSGLITTFYSNILYILIGRMYSSSQLGYFTNASKLNEVASQSITIALQKVTYPVLCSIQNEEKMLKQGFRRLIRTSTFINFPIMVGLAAIAPSLIDLLYGDIWRPMVIYFQLLCFAGMLYPIHAINLNILQVKGRPDLYLKISILKKLITTSLIIVSIWLNLGVIGLVGALVIDSYIAFLINSYFSERVIAYSSIEQIKDLLIFFINTIIMGVIVYFSAVLLPGNNLLRIITQIAIGIFVYVGLSRLTKIRELKEVWELIRYIISKPSNRKYIKQNV
jgi:O-antigen/teichoic acid export membrane protein